MERREHLTLEGLHKIISIRASMNNGLSPKLKLAFPDIVPVVRPLVENQKVQDPNWLAGFTTGEGSFIVNIKASKTHSIGFQVLLVFELTQHMRDERLMRSLIKLFGCPPRVKFIDIEMLWIFVFRNSLTSQERLYRFFKNTQLKVWRL